MAAHDYRCAVCKALWEVVYSQAEYPFPERINCPACGSPARRVWLKAPSVRGDDMNYYDVQLGAHISTRKQRDDMLKERGLVALGADEWRRTQSQLHADPNRDGWDHKRFMEAAEKAANDLKYGNIPAETPREVHPDTIVGSDGGSTTPASGVA